MITIFLIILIFKKKSVIAVTEEAVNNALVHNEAKTLQKNIVTITKSLAIKKD